MFYCLDILDKQNDILVNRDICSFSLLHHLGLYYHVFIEKASDFHCYCLSVLVILKKLSLQFYSLKKILKPTGGNNLFPWKHVSEILRKVT